MRVMTWRKVRISSHRLESAGVALLARQTDLIHAACRRRGLSGRRPVSSQPNTYLSRHIHLGAVPLLQLPPFSPEGDKAAPFVAALPEHLAEQMLQYIYHYIQTRCGDKVRPAAEGGADVTAALSHQRYTDLSSSFQKYTAGEVGTYVAVCQRGQF